MVPILLRADFLLVVLTLDFGGAGLDGRKNRSTRAPMYAAR